MLAATLHLLMQNPKATDDGAEEDDDGHGGAHHLPSTTSSPSASPTIAIHFTAVSLSLLNPRQVDGYGASTALSRCSPPPPWTAINPVFAGKRVSTCNHAQIRYPWPWRHHNTKLPVRFLATKPKGRARRPSSPTPLDPPYHQSLTTNRGAIRSLSPMLESPTTKAHIEEPCRDRRFITTQG